MSSVRELAETTLGKAERFSVKAELQRADEVLDDGETVDLIAVGSYEGAGNSLILVTDRRLIALNQTGGLFGKKLQTHDLLFNRIVSVQSENGRVHGSVTLNTAGGDVKIQKMLPTGRAADIAAALRKRL